MEPEFTLNTVAFLFLSLLRSFSYIFAEETNPWKNKTAIVNSLDFFSLVNFTYSYKVELGARRRDSAGLRSP